MSTKSKSLTDIYKSPVLESREEEGASRHTPIHPLSGRSVRFNPSLVIPISKMKKVGISGVSIQQIRESIQNAFEASYKKIAPRTAFQPMPVSSKEWRAYPKFFATFVYMAGLSVILYVEYDEEEQAGTIECQARWGGKPLIGSGSVRKNPSAELWAILAIEDAFGSYCTRITEIQPPGDEPIAVKSEAKSGRINSVCMFSISFLIFIIFVIFVAMALPGSVGLVVILGVLAVFFAIGGMCLLSEANRARELELSMDSGLDSKDHVLQQKE